MKRSRPPRTLTAAAAIGAAIVLTVPTAINALAYTPSPGVVMTPDSVDTCNKFPCVLYPKSTQLPSGRIVLAFEDSRGAVDGQDIPIWKSDDNGDTWQELSEVGSPADLSNDPAYDKYISNWTNPYLYVMPETVGDLVEGTLLLSSVVSGDDEWYNEQKAKNPNWTPNGDGDRRDLAIALYSSTDEGQTWTFEDIIATGGWQGGSAGRIGSAISNANVNRQVDPVWEPHLAVHDGQLIAWYSDENDYSGYDPDTLVPELTPNNDTGKDSGNQILVHKTWDGTGWSEAVLDVAGVTHTVEDGDQSWTVIGGGRPGMITSAETTDGKWIQTFEYFGGGRNTRMKVCDDLLHCEPWDGSTWGEGPWETAPGIAGGSPVLLELPDGRIVYNDANDSAVVINESGLSTELAPPPYGPGTAHGWKNYNTPVAPGYSRNLQYVRDTGQLLIIQASWTAPGTASPIRFGHVDIGHSAGAYYTLQNRKTGEVLSTAQDNTQDFQFYPRYNAYQPDIITWSNNPDNDTQRWHVLPRSNGTFSFINKAGGRAVSLNGGTASQGNKLVQWVHKDGSDQQWNLIPTDDGYFKVQTSANSDLYASGYWPGGNVDAYEALGGTDAYATDWQILPDVTEGFHQPVTAGVNTIKAGRTVPLKFTFADVTNADLVSLSATKSNCAGGPTADSVLVANPGTQLRFDWYAGQFIFNWKTQKADAGKCYVVTATTHDGDVLNAEFVLN
ncbi:hypothetical protein GCM10025789_26920 [Tessaracoccus lubricantis]|uniref:Ricin B lectin domain-containing protein n=1 Tax=Tessaracoccus lubricantis TaxID=545543 RepID=A0ABP9FK20_9ACTN